MFALAPIVAFLAASASASPLVARQESLSARVPGGGGEYPVCQTIPIRWSGGTGPYTMNITMEVDRDNYYRQWSREYYDIRAHEMNWAADADAGTAVTFTVTDSTGGAASVGNIRIAEGSDTCCRNQALSWRNNRGASTWYSACNTDKIYYPHLRCTYTENSVGCVDNHKPDSCTDAPGGFTCPPDSALKKRQAAKDPKTGCIRYGETRCKDTPDGGKVCVGGGPADDPTMACVKIPNGGGSFCCPKVEEEATPAKRSIGYLEHGCRAYSGVSCWSDEHGRYCKGGNPPKDDSKICKRHPTKGIVCCPKDGGVDPLDL